MIRKINLKVNNSSSPTKIFIKSCSLLPFHQVLSGDNTGYSWDTLQGFTRSGDQDIDIPHTDGNSSETGHSIHNVGY